MSSSFLFDIFVNAHFELETKRYTKTSGLLSGRHAIFGRVTMQMEDAAFRWMTDFRTARYLQAHSTQCFWHVMVKLLLLGKITRRMHCSALGWTAFIQPGFCRRRPHSCSQNYGQAVACGSNFLGWCDIPSLDEGVSYCQVSAGVYHTVLLRSDGHAVACSTRGWRNFIQPNYTGKPFLVCGILPCAWPYCCVSRKPTINTAHRGRPTDMRAGFVFGTRKVEKFFDWYFLVCQNLRWVRPLHCQDMSLNQKKERRPGTTSDNFL